MNSAEDGGGEFGRGEGDYRECVLGGGNDRGGLWGGLGGRAELERRVEEGKWC
jgi:hypothetical protein